MGLIHEAITMGIKVQGDPRDLTLLELRRLVRHISQLPKIPPEYWSCRHRVVDTRVPGTYRVIEYSTVYAEEGVVEPPETDRLGRVDYRPEDNKLVKIIT